jgi:hypothetical protein
MILLKSLERPARNQLNPNHLRRYIDMPDKTLICKDCNSEFVFTEGEQEFYKEKGFENEPQRCGDCRRARKQQRRNNSFNSGGNRGYNRGY